ncbi:MAG: FAD-linked oxidase C-terminal domain-containing protein [Gemmataceae bacterium]
MDSLTAANLRDDLKGFFQGELRFDEPSRSLYATDASIFQVMPAGVALPKSEEDVAALVKYAAQHKTPLVPRGAGTGLAGEAVGPGIVVETSKHLRNIIETGSDWVRVQPGVTLESLNRHLALTGRRFAPNPTHSVCTLGGMLATDASGSNAMKHGSTRDHVLGLRVVLDDGSIHDISSVDWPLTDHSPNHLHDILLGLGLMLEANRELLDANRSKMRLDRVGYRLHDALQRGKLDAAKLLVGSEGTLALFVEAKLRTIPAPGGRAIVLIGFGSLDAALQATKLVLPFGPSACELIDRRLVSIARGSEDNAAVLIDASVEAVLLLEFEEDSQDFADAIAQRLVDRARRGDMQALQIHRAATTEQCDRFWRLRESALPSLYGTRGGQQPIPLIEDVGVPVEVLPDYIRRVQEILREHEVTASFLVHASVGQIHARPFIDLSKPDETSKLSLLAERVHNLVIDLGGTVSGQHGVGLARLPWVARQLGSLYPLHRQVKALFDPHGIFNPGKMVDSDAKLPAWPLRSTARIEPAKPMLRWQPLEMLAEPNHCNGCGQCRTEAPGSRMCPVFRATADEAGSPRSKANLYRHLLAENADPKAIAADDVRKIAEHCVHCNMCVRECPAHVNVSRLMLEAKATHVAVHGLDRSQWFFARLERFARWGSRLSLASGLMLRSRFVRWLLGWTFGISPRRRLPTFTRRHFLRRARKRGWTKPPAPGKPPVVLFADIFATYADPHIAESAGLVMEHHGYAVHVPEGLRSSGMEALTQGDVETARECAQNNIRLLAEIARDGTPIVCVEPSSALMLRQETAALLDDIDVRLVADRTIEFTAFMSGIERRGELKTDFKPLPLSLTLGHHVPCHVKALQDRAAGPSLLARIPGIQVETIDLSCSGMAGTFGLKKGNEETSRRAGEPMLDRLRMGDIQFGSTECSSCRMQMEDAGGKRTLHPAQYLAWAYGLVPSLEKRLKEPIRELVLR